MKFIEKIAQIATEHAGSRQVKGIFIGLSYCLAELDNGSCGVAYVFTGDKSCGCTLDLPKRPLAGSSAAELLSFAGKNTLANTISLAVANAVMAPLAEPDTRGDILDHLQLSPGTRVGMVGHFAPLVPQIKKQGASLTVFDINADLSAGILGPESIRERMPECDVALVTATSIINETFDDILTHAAGCRHVAVLGPSTPIAAACYEGTPVTCASGLIVRDSEKTRNAIAEAGGTRMFIRFTDKVNVNIAGAVAA